MGRSDFFDDDSKPSNEGKAVRLLIDFLTQHEGGGFLSSSLNEEIALVSLGKVMQTATNIGLLSSEFEKPGIKPRLDDAIQFFTEQQKKQEADQELWGSCESFSGREGLADVVKEIADKLSQVKAYHRNKRDDLAPPDESEYKPIKLE